MTEGQEPDEQLLRRFAAGDAPAFAALYERHELKLWRYVQRSVRNEATADEIHQDVWFAVARKARDYEYRPGARFTTWLFTLAHNRLVDVHRSGLRQPQSSGDADDSQRLVEQVPDAAVHEPQQQVEASDQARAILSAVERLPADQREAFLLQAEGELTVEEIAAATGVSFETAKSRLRYARSKLQDWLQEHA